MTTETAASIMDYDTATQIGSTATAELVRESMDAGPTGAVLAYESRGVWHYCPPSQRSLMAGHLGRNVVTVYVEEA